jgi:hypothetical protein
LVWRQFTTTFDGRGCAKAIFFLTLLGLFARSARLRRPGVFWVYSMVFCPFSWSSILVFVGLPSSRLLLLVVSPKDPDLFGGSFWWGYGCEVVGGGGDGGAADLVLARI